MHFSGGRWREEDRCRLDGEGGACYRRVPEETAQ